MTKRSNLEDAEEIQRKCSRCLGGGAQYTPHHTPDTEAWKGKEEERFQCQKMT
jgi:hypothetical protein